MFTFRKKERITSLKEIESIFERGKNRSTTVYPVMAIYRMYPLPQDGCTPPVKVLMSVAKKRLHHAVDRNRAKRQLREAYRLQRHTLTDIMATLDQGHTGLLIAFVWLGDKPQPSATIHSSVGKILSTVAKHFETRHAAQQQSALQTNC